MKSGFTSGYLIDMLFHHMRMYKTVDPDELMPLIESSLSVDESRVARLILEKAHGEGITNKTELMKLMTTTINAYKSGELP